MTTNTDALAQGKTTAPVWVVRAGRNGEDESSVLEEGVVLMDFPEIPDLRAAGPDRSDISENEEGIKQMMEKTYGKNGHLASRLVHFTCRIEENHIIVLPLKTRSRQIAIGRVTGPYEYRKIDGISRHTRAVKWERIDVSRSEIGQDLLDSLSAQRAVFRVWRNNAEKRFVAIMNRERDPEKESDSVVDTPTNEESSEKITADTADVIDIAEVAQNQILDRLQKQFRGHELTKLVDRILAAEGYETLPSMGGPDGGVDILAGRGAMGFDQPRICVQVKATEKPADVDVFRQLMGTMDGFKANHGLLVSFGGFTKAVEREARKEYFRVRLWTATDLLKALYRTYEKLPEEIQAEIPMQRIWTIVPD